ncbi:MAG: YciI family protein, partial [Vicinamibacteraceae bacterium]
VLDTGGCHPSVKGARIRRSNGTVTVTDGPFAETKELIAGYAVIQVQSKEEAVAWTKRFLEVAGDGESEIRQLHEASDFGAEVTPEIREQDARSRARMAANQ